MKKIFTFLLIGFSIHSLAQQLGPLTVEKIMRDAKWMGVSPSDIHWRDDSKKIYFNWNPDKNDRDELFGITISNTTPQRIDMDERRELAPEYGEWNKKHTIKLFEKNGDIYLENVAKGKTVQLTSTTERESNPRFIGNESEVSFIRGDNLFAMKLNSGELVQLTNFVRNNAGANQQTGGKRGRQGNAIASAANQQEKWLKAQQLDLFDVIKKEDKDRKEDSIENKELELPKLKEINVDDKRVSGLTLSPDGRYITYRLITIPKDEKRTIVPDYVTSSGWTEDIPNREKVGGPQATSETFIFDKQKDTIYAVKVDDIPGIKDMPAYMKDYPKEQEEYLKRNADREVTIYGPLWSEDGKNAVVIIGAQD
ncbi:MAG: S9 family peptidase, partial [Bacteroidetes bacterium]|nr:S9 family peptidase [Bacteroidota bacterium]